MAQAGGIGKENMLLRTTRDLLWIILWIRFHMETIQVVLDVRLLKAADLAAKRHKLNRSALIRDAVREHLRRLHTQELEERERKGYETHPQRVEEYQRWEEAGVWPDE